jgi:hypothetical protein
MKAYGKWRNRSTFFPPHRLLYAMGRAPSANSMRGWWVSELVCTLPFRELNPDSSATKPIAHWQFFVWILRGGVHNGSIRHCGHYWPIVPAPGDCEDGEVGGMNGFDRGNRSTRRKPAPTSLCPPQIPLDQTRAATVGSQRLTVSAMAWPIP